MRTALIIVVYSIVNTLIISNGGDNFWTGWWMGLSFMFVYQTLDIISKTKSKHDKYKEWADKLNRGEKL